MLTDRKDAKYRGTQVVVLTLMLMFCGVTMGLRGTGLALAQDTPQIGAVEAIALDGSGNGWAWAGPPAQEEAHNFLLRIENGSWRIAIDSEQNSSVLLAGARVNNPMPNEH